MSIRKLAKSIAKRTGEDVEEVYNRFIKNKKKLRRMEDRMRMDINVEGYKKQADFHSPRTLDKLKWNSKAKSYSFT